jgi:hypothetical protein
MNRLIAESMERRALLRAAGLGSLGALAGCAVAPNERASGKSAAAPRALDFRDPVDNVYGLVKLEAAHDGRVVVNWSEGAVHGMQPGVLGRKMLAYEGCGLRVCRPRADGAIEFRSRAWLFFKDAESGAFIDRYLNPLTGETVEIQQFKAGITGGAYTVNGYESTGIQMESSAFNTPFVLRWHTSGERVWCAVEAFTRWKVPGTEVWRAEQTVGVRQAALAELLDPTVASCATTSHWQSQTEWLRWLNMGQVPGHHLWYSVGRKLNGPD